MWVFSEGRAQTGRHTTLGRLLLKRRGASFTGVEAPSDLDLDGYALDGSAATEENARQFVDELVGNGTDLHQAGPLLPTRPRIAASGSPGCPVPGFGPTWSPRNGAWPKRWSRTSSGCESQGRPAPRANAADHAQDPSICADPIRGALGGVGVGQVARHRCALTLIYGDGRTDGCPRVLTDERG
jgi:hypothetical protein